MDLYRHFFIEKLCIAGYSRREKGSDKLSPVTPFNSFFGYTVCTSAQASSSAFGFQRSTPSFGNAFDSSSSSALGASTSVSRALSSALGASDTQRPSNPFGTGPSFFSAHATSTVSAAGGSTFHSSASTALGTVFVSAFGGSAQSLLFGASQARFGCDSFAALSSAVGGGTSSSETPPFLASLLRASQSGSLFLGGQFQGPFFGSSFATAGALGGFALPFQGLTLVQMSYSSRGGSGFGSFAASAASTGSSAFRDSRFSPFETGSVILASSSSPSSSGTFGAGTDGSIFGRRFGGPGCTSSQSTAQPTQQTHEPLEASPTNNSFGDSNLFLEANASAQSAQNTLGTFVVNMSKHPGQTQQKFSSAVPGVPRHLRENRPISAVLPLKLYVG